METAMTAPTATPLNASVREFFRAAIHGNDLPCLPLVTSAVLEIQDALAIFKCFVGCPSTTLLRRLRAAPWGAAIVIIPPTSSSS